MRQSIVIGLAVVTVPVALAALLLPSGSLAPPPTPAPVKLFPALQGAVATAAKLTVAGPDDTVTVERTPPADGKQGGLGDGWTLPAKGGYPVQATTVRPILGGLAAIQTVTPMTAQPKLYDRLDLGPPGKGSQSRQVTLDDASGHDLAKLVVGRHNDDAVNQENDGVYVRKADEAQTWLAKPPITLPSDALGWIDRKILDIDTDTIKDVRLSPADGKALEFTRDKAADPLAVKDLPKDTKLKSATPGNDVAEAFRYLDLDDVKPAADVTDKPAAFAHVETFDGLSVDLTLIKQGDAAWAFVTAAGADKAQKAADEITQRTKGWAYKLPEGRAATLERKLADLIDTPEPPPGMPTKIRPPPLKPPAAVKSP